MFFKSFSFFSLLLWWWDAQGLTPMRRTSMGIRMSIPCGTKDLRRLRLFVRGRSFKSSAIGCFRVGSSRSDMPKVPRAPIGVARVSTGMGTYGAVAGCTAKGEVPYRSLSRSNPSAIAVVEVPSWRLVMCGYGTRTTESVSRSEANASIGIVRMSTGNPNESKTTASIAGTEGFKPVREREFTPSRTGFFLYAG